MGLVIDVMLDVIDSVLLLIICEEVLLVVGLVGVNIL